MADVKKAKFRAGTLTLTLIRKKAENCLYVNPIMETYDMSVSEILYTSDD